MLWKESESCSVVSYSLQLHGLCSPWNSPGQNTGVGSCSPIQGIFPAQRANPGLPRCRWILLSAESPGKPKNTGVGSPSLLEWIFLNQESNWGLLHCRQILHQLSYQRSPKIFTMWPFKEVLDIFVFNNCFLLILLVLCFLPPLLSFLRF